MSLFTNVTWLPAAMRTSAGLMPVDVSVIVAAGPAVDGEDGLPPHRATTSSAAARKQLRIRKERRRRPPGGLGRIHWHLARTGTAAARRRGRIIRGTHEEGPYMRKMIVAM